MKVVSIRHPTARRKHKCSYCLGTIEINEQYESQFCIGDYPYEWKSHLSCRDLVSLIFDRDEIREGISEEDFLYSVESIAHDLGFQGSIQDKIRRVKEHYKLKI